MTEWLPTLGSSKSPRYLAIVESLEADIAAGRVVPGSRLLPQRDLAIALGLSVGTVSKAYAEAEQRGLVSGEIGRGTFVLAKSMRDEATNTSQGFNLALNVPPQTGEADDIRDALVELAGATNFNQLTGYLPHQGQPEHRVSLSKWLGHNGFAIDAERVMVTQGLQHAASIALTVLTRSGDTVLCEALTYSGLLSLAAHQGLNLYGVAMDEQGANPDELDRAIAETGARVYYAMPTLQTPTAATMPTDRRQQIAAVLRRRGVYVIEDDAYGFLVPDAPAPLSHFVPDLGFYATSFAKCLAPALRVGALYAPKAFRDRLINGLRATGWMAAPIMVDVVARLINSGRLEQQAERKRKEAQLRSNLAKACLGPWLPTIATGGFHVWLPIPPGRTVNGLVTQAASAGIILAPSDLMSRNTAGPRGIRLCLGGPPTLRDLEHALRLLRGILDRPEAMSVI